MDNLKLTSPPKKGRTSNPIYEALRKAAEPASGLFVLPLPTGAGKTYNCCRLIADELKKPQQERRKIVYVTDAKRQLDATVSDIHANLKRLKVRVKEGDIVRVYSQDEQWQKALTDEDITAELEALTLPGSAPKLAKGRRRKSREQQEEFLLKEQPEYEALKRLYRNLRNYRSQALTDDLIKDIRKCRRALNCWKYCVGPHKEGKFDTIHNKVYIRKLVCEQGNPDPVFMEQLIHSLGDGWNRISEFSAHPSIFKFLRERLEMYKVEMRAKEVKS